MTWTSVSKVVLMIDMPTDKTTWYGPTLGPTVWGQSFTGMHGTTTNAAFFDGHSKSEQNGALFPQGTTNNGSTWQCANCPNSQYESGQGVAQEGQMWMFWGTSYADPSHQ
jgi:prepilin-type processing-associated H-X9-DG protein